MRLPLSAALILCFALFFRPAAAQEGENPPPYHHPPVVDSASTGWSCGNFPCGDDLVGFQQRIRAPAGYALEYIGRFPGQIQQIAYDAAGRLHATVLEEGSAYGAVYHLDEAGRPVRYPALFYAPIGLAAHPQSGALYLSARVSDEAGGIWQLRENLPPLLIRADLPCCAEFPGNQVNGIAFDEQGILYIGVGARSDHGEVERLAEEAALLRVDPASGESEIIARGLRNPYDIAIARDGRLFLSDQGTHRGVGDRLLQIQAGAHYAWPYWRSRGCVICPARPSRLEFAPDLLALPPHSTPRGIAIYEGGQFPRNLLGSLFVALWLDEGHEGSARILRVDPASGESETFVSGLPRPTDVLIGPAGALVIADAVYGDVWRVRYAGLPAASTPSANSG